MDISFADDDEPTEQIRQADDLAQTKEVNTSDSDGQHKMDQSTRFNPTEAILATMQLLPLPCAKVGIMTADEIERNVSVIRSYAQGQQPNLKDLMAYPATGTPLRRKSKSQMGLNDLKDDEKTPTTGICDLDELRSFQRQLQNFPSLSELRRHPVQNWLTSSSYRRSLSPATSSRWLDGNGQDIDTLGPISSVEQVVQPQQQQQLPARPSFSRSTSRSSSESRCAHNTESYALAILQILQVCFIFF